MSQIEQHQAVCLFTASMAYILLNACVARPFTLSQ